MDEPFDWLLEPEPPSRSQRPTAAPAAPNIADPYADVLLFLDEPTARGVIALLAVGFYDGWRPTHHEVARSSAVPVHRAGPPVPRTGTCRQPDPMHRRSTRQTVLRSPDQP